LPQENNTPYFSLRCRCLGGRDAAALVGISICVAVCRRMVCVSAAALIGDDGTEVAGEHHCWEQRCAEKFCPLSMYEAFGF